MAQPSVRDGAIAESLVFLDHFKALEDPRQSMKVRYPLPEVLLLCLAAVVSGAESISDIALFGRKKLDVLRRLRPFRYGAPSHDHLGDILASLDCEQFRRCFAAWVAKQTGVAPDVVAIDGKTVRRSHDRAKAKGAIHMVSAFAAEQRLVLGQVAVEEKSNEIVAIPKLLELLRLEGAIVTIDAMGCQREIASAILDKKANYILALKGNQSSLHDDIKLFAAEQKRVNFKDTKVSTHYSVDGDHGRIEERNYTVFHDVAWLQERHDWPGLQAFVMVESSRETPTSTPGHYKTQTETRFYITSLTQSAKQVGPAIRAHWLVENGLHWVLDVVFRDDDCRLRTENAPINFTAIKHMALNFLKTVPEKLSLRLKRKAAAWDDDFLYSILAQR
jgi:predicted transposase YbfD/YdcC